MNQSTTHSINHSLHQPLTPSTTHSINHSLHQPLTPSTTHSINQSINQPLNPSMINQINQVLAKNSVHFSIHTIIIPLYYHHSNITLQHTFNNYFLLTKALTCHSYIIYFNIFLVNILKAVPWSWACRVWWDPAM